MVNSMNEEIRTLLIFLYFILIVVLTIYSFLRANKFRKWMIKFTNDSTFPKAGLPTMIALGLLSFWGVNSSSIFFAVLTVLMCLGFYISYFIMFRRKCPYCRNTVKDHAVICPHCGSNISNSILE